MIAQSRDPITVLDDPFATFLRLGRQHRLSGHVLIERAGHVHSVRAHEQSEHGTDAGIDVVYLVAAVTSVIAVSEIERPAIADRVHEIDRGLRHMVVTNA